MLEDRSIDGAKWKLADLVEYVFEPQVLQTCLLAKSSDTGYLFASPLEHTSKDNVDYCVLLEIFLGIKRGHFMIFQYFANPQPQRLGTVHLKGYIIVCLCIY